LRRRLPAAVATPRSRHRHPPATSGASNVTSRMPGYPRPRAPRATRKRRASRTGRSLVAARPAIARTAPVASRLRPPAPPVMCPPRCQRSTRSPATRNARAATRRPTPRRATIARRAPGTATRTGAITSLRRRSVLDATCSGGDHGARAAREGILGATTSRRPTRGMKNARVGEDPDEA
jgi:hypothetical protein